MSSISTKHNTLLPLLPVLPVFPGGEVEAEGFFLFFLFFPFFFLSLLLGGCGSLQFLSSGMMSVRTGRSVSP